MPTKFHYICALAQTKVWHPKWKGMRCLICLDNLLLSDRMIKMGKIFLLLGTNQGDLKKNLLKAICGLEKCGIKIIKRSSIYKTKPWGNEAQPDFLNMALEVKCDYSPQKLLRVIKEIEKKMGRKTTVKRWKPRIMDIDILFYADKIINNKDLTIPHKEFYNRPFAIIPVAEISPDFVPPHSHQSIKDYLSVINSDGIEIYCN